jgi:hypothetical protein
VTFVGTFDGRLECPGAVVVVGDGVAAVGDLVVVMATDRADELVGGELVLGDGQGVVAFQPVGGVTAADLAALVAFVDCDLQWFGNVAGLGDDGLDVDTVGDDQLQEPVGQDRAGVLDRDRPDAGDLADLTG